MKREILPVLFSLLSAFCIEACNIALSGENEETRKEIETLVASGEYEKAMQMLEDAGSRAAAGDAFNMKLNEIILDIDSGQCALAIRKLHALRTPELTPTEERWIYYFSAFARICDADSSHSASQEDLSQALEDLLVAESLGVPCRGQISSLLEKLNTPCETFQTSLEKAANTPQTAIDYKPEEFFAVAQRFTVCPKNSVWLSFEGRTLEEISISALFRSLKRTKHFDDSSQLPYAQPRIRVYAKDLDGNPVQPPILDKSLPLPEGAPQIREFEARSLDLPTFIAKAGYAQYFLELSTEYNGEVSAEITLKRDIDCNGLDDELTWTDDLKPVDFEPEADRLYNRMLLCPGRQDQLTTTLQPGQSVMIVLYSSDANDITMHLKHGDHPPVSIELKEAQQNPNYKHLYGSGVHYSSPQLENIATRDTLGALFSPTLITFKNTLDVPARSSLFLEQNTDHPISYVFQYILSEDCKKENRGSIKTLDLELPVSQDNQQRPLSTYRMGWLCEQTTLELNPIFKSKSLTGQYLTAMTLLTSDHERPNDFLCENDLRTDLPETSDFLVEQGTYRPWIHRPVPCIKTKLLMRPITERSVLKLKTSDTPGFWTLLMTPQTPNAQMNLDSNDASPKANPNTDSSPSENQDENETQHNQDSQNQNTDSQDGQNQSQSNGNEHENDAEQSPSDSPTSTTGSGQGTQGGNTGHGSQQHTVIQSTAQYDKIRLDEILDNYESSRKIRPTQNMPLHENRDDEKNW